LCEPEEVSSRKNTWDFELGEACAEILEKIL